MVSPTDTQFLARLGALNDKFAAGVPATLAQLSACGARCGAQRPDPALLSELQQLLHGVAGSAATFGFRHLGAHARALEQRLRALADTGGNGGNGDHGGAAHDWQHWRASLDAYIAWALRDPRSDLPPG